MHAAMFELMRGNVARIAANASELARLADEHDLSLWRAFATFLHGWLAAQGSEAAAGLLGMRRGFDLLDEQNAVIFAGLLKVAQAEAEARAGDVERAVAILDEALATCERTGHRAFEAELHRVRGETVLMHDPVNRATAEEALETAIAIAKQQGARSYELLASLSLAKLHQSNGRLVEAHAVLAPALEGFSPTPEMLEIAEAQTLLAMLAQTEEVKAADAQRQQRLHLQTAYAQAVMWSKGFAAEETKAAFARATELASTSDDFSQRFAAAHGQWTLALVRGELRLARETASTFLKEAEDAGRLVEVGVARRGLALACCDAGDFAEARIHCERAIEACEPERDRETRERFSEDTGTTAMSCLAETMWQLGEVERARELIDEANRRASELGHVPSMSHPLLSRSYLAFLRGDAAAALNAAEELQAHSREHGIPHWRAAAELFAGWARGRLHDATAGAAELQRAMAALADSGARGYAWHHNALLAELEAETLGADSALVRIDEALALARQGEIHCDLPFPYLLRGEFLLKRDPSNSAPAKEAFRTALAIASEQGARSWGLRAALSLAKLYQSTACLVDAHAILAPALEGFSPTPEMPEIAEAQVVLAALADTDEVKTAIARLQRRLDLQRSYGHALMWGKGFGAVETDAAFARVGELAGPAEAAAARFAAYDARCLSSFIRGEYRLARDEAETFLREAEAEGRATEAGAARRMLGVILLYQGELKAARSVLERAIAEYVSERDGKTQVLFGRDTEVSATSYLALAEWHLGEVERARRLSDQAIRRAEEMNQGAAITNALFWRTILETRRDDVAATRLAVAALLASTKEYGIKTYADMGQIYASWARGRLFGPEEGASELKRALEACMALGYRAGLPLFQGLLAELEAATRGFDGALKLIDEGLKIAAETGEHFSDPYLYRLRGDILLKRDPADPAPAEDAYRTASAVAKQQSARSYILLASFSQAKLYQLTGRPIEAHAVLAPALEGFSPTPEMPEIAEARALLESLPHGGEGATASRDKATKG
jgi:predicted ATPase